MLERVDFSKKHLTKAEYKPRHDALVDELVLLQQRAVNQGVGLAVVFEGWNGAGKGARISDLIYNLDARSTSVYVRPNIVETQNVSFSGKENGVLDFYPFEQEFWKALGPRGSITFYDQCWYSKAADFMVLSGFFEGAADMPADKFLESLGETMALESVERRGKRKPNDGKAAKIGKVGPASIQEMAAREERAVGSVARYLDAAASLERQLADDGYIVVKFFVHVSKKAQHDRLKKLREDPATAWRVSDVKWATAKLYDTAYTLYDALLEGSNFSYAPWIMVNGEDRREANLTIAQTLVDVLKDRLNQTEDPAVAAAAAKASANSAGKLTEQSEELTVEQRRAAAQAAADAASRLAPAHSNFFIKADYPRLDQVDHSLILSPEDYRAQLKKEQKRLNRLEMEMYQKRIPMMIMFEGWDAAGKGGAIKRVAQALDARSYTIFPSPAPTKPELMHPFLWRYWTRLPKAGHVGIYDRSWYGRVLVERVEGFASPAQWSRAYDEINEFEREMVRWGALLLKFWVDIDPDEQLNRFTARQNDPAKQWKITDEDWRNREKYPQYKAAAQDMFRLTSTMHAPWHVLESDNKYYARVKALKTINEALELRLG